MRVLPTILLLCSALLPSTAFAYGVLSHEELIDMSWEVVIRPALVQRFPSATAEQVKDAHAYAYGGSVIQDLGYYPFGNHEFTNMLHYVRSGDFVSWMLRDSRSINEFAFALGALSHYIADCAGHPAVNAGVAIEYPKLRDRYGNMVTYEDDPEAHLKTEFSFDVLQVAKRRYISKQYHDFIGFQVSEDLLERAFLDTYGIKLDDLLPVDDLSIETFRFGVSRVIPEMTQVALASRKPDVPHEKRDKARSEFLYHLSRADYEKEFGAKYQKPGFFARLIAFLLNLIPKFGPFKALKYKDPTPQTEDRYFKSMNNVVNDYIQLVHEVDTHEMRVADTNSTDLPQSGKGGEGLKRSERFMASTDKHDSGAEGAENQENASSNDRANQPAAQEAISPSLHFENRNLDTGGPSRAGTYKLADRTYAGLVRRLYRDHFHHLTPDLKANIVDYFASGPIEENVKGRALRDTQRDLNALKAAPTVAPASLSIQK